MSETVKLHAYNYSVYSWIARLALAEKGVAFEVAQINPFQLDDLNSNSNPHPFNRVPVLIHGDIQIYETSAICRYVDEAFDGPPLQPDKPAERARMNQIIAVTDAYAYWPLVRQVYSNAVFRPQLGETADNAELEAGLAEAPAILAALEDLAKDNVFLVSDHQSLADIHLAPVLNFFAAAEAGARLLSTYPKLNKWLAAYSLRKPFSETQPDQPGN